MGSTLIPPGVRYLFVELQFCLTGSVQERGSSLPSEALFVQCEGGDPEYCHGKLQMVLQVYLLTISALSPTRCLKPGAFSKLLVNRKRLRITLIGDKKKINQSPVELNDQQLQYPEYRCLMLTYRRILFFCQSRFSEVEVELSYFLDILTCCRIRKRRVKGTLSGGKIETFYELSIDGNI